MKTSPGLAGTRGNLCTGEELSEVHNHKPFRDPLTARDSIRSLY